MKEVQASDTWDRDTPNLIERHFINNFLSPIRSEIFLIEAKGRPRMQDLRELLLKQREKYANYWQSELVDPEREGIPELQSAIQARFAEIAPEVIGRVDSIIEEMRMLAAETNIDLNKLKSLISEMFALRPEERNQIEPPIS
jgi:hypothetical protein